MLRVIGGVLVLLGATGIGYGKTRQFYQRMALLRELRRGMELVLCEMNYTLYSVPKLLSIVGSNIKNPGGAYLKNLGQAIEEGIPRHKAHTAALERTKGISLPKDGLMALIEWSTALGQFDPEGENRMMKLSIDRMEQALRTYGEEKTQISKSYTLLSISAGLALLILIL